MATRWGVVATVLEDIGTIKAFVAHYRSLGADEIHLYLDDPDDRAAAFLERFCIAGLHVTRCDTAHWSNARPPTQEGRQRANANRAYTECSVDWLIHLDADEFLHAPTGIAAALDGLGDDCKVARVPPAEAFAHTKADPVDRFRLALPRTPKGSRIGLHAYGREYPLLVDGLLSHAAGKSFVRTGIVDMALSIHGPIYREARAEATDLPGVLLLHLHGRDEKRWLASARSRIETGAYRAALHDNKRRAGQLDGRGLNAHLRHLIETEGDDGLKAFFGRVNRFGPEKLILRRAEALVEVRLDLEAKIAGVFGEPTSA